MFSLGEVAAPIIVFGDIEAKTVQRELVVEFFGKLKGENLVQGFDQANKVVENERLPWELGWMKREEKVGLRDVLDVVEAIRDATSLLTGKSA